SPTTSRARRISGRASSTLNAVPGSGVARSRSAGEPSSQGIGAAPASARRTPSEVRAAAGPTGANVDLGRHIALRSGAAPRCGRGRELEDQRAGLEGSDVAVVLGGEPVQVGNRELAPVSVDRRAQGQERRGRVGRVRGGTAFVPEDRVLAVRALARVTAVAAV